MRKVILAALVASIGSVLSPLTASAVGLGQANTSSRIGAPLRVEIQMLADDAERIELSCIRLAGAPPGYSDDVPWLNNGSLSFESGPHGRVLIIKARPSSHPAIMLGLRIDCGMGLRRDYTLLLNPPGAEEAFLPSMPASVNTVAAKEPTYPPAITAERIWLVQSGDSVHSIAESLIPDDRNTQRRFARAILNRNVARLGSGMTLRSPLPVGIELNLPTLPTPGLAALPERAPQDTLPSPRAGSTTPAPRSSKVNGAGTNRDRLFVTGGTEDSLRMVTSIGPRKELNEEQRSRLRAEMQLIATLDEKIATQIELSERLRQLEAMQERLKQDATRLEGELQTARALQSTPQNAADVPITIQAAPAPQASSAEQTNRKTPAPWYTSSTFIAAGLLTIASGIAAALWIGRRRRNSSALEGDAISTAHQPDVAGDMDVVEHLITPLSEADIWPDEEGHAPKASARTASAMEGALGQFTASGLGPASLLQIIDDDVEEHDSAIELAEIMMSFGRVHGAAQTLADFIRSNPKQAVKPWLKLLEVYRAANMRTEFDALTVQLNKTFNVKTVEWDAFELARQTPESLESMPHILARLNEIWGKRECQAYLHGLLRDNRQGTRQGFPLAIVDEILTLLGVLESQIGPYRPDIQSPGADPVPASATHISTSASLNVPPIMTTETPTQPIMQPIRSPQPASRHRASAPAAASSAFATGTGLHQLDFELDMTDLSKTLHLNLDDLGEDGNFMKDTDSI
ncbi:hypothetical protein Q9Q94_14020 [Uliginosibacterium sp. 31-16]|uniref:type IV pilus assembly protein FimV n=1 Tax=Uliginosibacterium sp. 31-16 TaxID=3068315 RepID=UPI00273F899C|nr:hypothetical protein [Uliginosibacterium sp. 31-16]MDP5240657.1 hypothetical protein [Uliginosibacterium sp. 31-16]